MNALVVYETKFGNTERIAQAIATALQARGTVELQPFDGVQAIPAGIDLLVVGGPTHGHGVDPALKAFLDALPAGAVDGVAAAAFDTRFHWPELLSGSAARGIAKRLEQKGAHLVAKPESFFVEHSEGPLADGEVLRAGSWALGLALAIAA